MRRLAITNQGTRTREIDVTSYVEIALAPPAADLAHPAFGKLFLETEYVPASSALLCHRRPRDPAERAALGRARAEPRRPDAGADRVGNRPRAVSRPRARSRARRRRSTAARSPGRPASCSIRSSACASASGSRRARPCGCRLPPAWPAIATPRRRSRRSTAIPAPRMRAFALALGARAERAAPPGDFERRRAAVRAAGLARAVRRRVAARAAATCSSTNQLGQPGLWRHSISGDLPILLVRVAGADALPLVAAGAAGAGVLAAQGAARRRRHPQRAAGRLPRRHADAADGAARRGPVAQLAAAARRRLPPARRRASPSAERTLLEAVARAVAQRRRAATCARSSIGRIRTGRRCRRRPPTRLRPATRPSRRAVDEPVPVPPLTLAQRPRRLRRRRPRRTSIVLEGDQETPAPWANVIANPGFGTIVTASGASHTWAENSRENRLTSFANDPVVGSRPPKPGSSATTSRARSGRRRPAPCGATRRAAAS